MEQLRIRRIGYALGAEVRGVDLKRSLDDATVAAIRAAWLDHLVLCFPDQDLNGDQLYAFTSRFGEVDKNLDGKADPDNPFVAWVTNRSKSGWDGKKVGDHWHSDRSCSESPMMGTFLLAKEVPEAGGDTMFANQYMAYESLSPSLRKILDDLSGIHDMSFQPGSDKRGLGHRVYDAPVVHPVVKIHPETQRKGLYVSLRVRRIAGMTEEESRPLLDFLISHATAYEMTYRHRWRINDLLMWDNRCAMHIALLDYDPRHDIRHMLRCSLQGPKSGFSVKELAETPALAVSAS